MGWRSDLGAGPERSSLDFNRLSGTRRQRVVAHQGHPGRRARQPTDRDHRSRFTLGCCEWPSQRCRTGRQGWTTYEWFVTSPINNYDVAASAGHYAHFEDFYEGEDGHLTLDFWPIANHLEAARAQWKQVKPMLACFENWFGPYPWYRDGYQLVESPHLGMEHQSAVAYGNGFQNGYKGKDLSGTGWGLAWDFIVIHESAHEWFGNSITSADIADMWVHESFANYSESLYTECQFGKSAGAQYARGMRKLVKNDKPIVGPFGVNTEGSGDMYYKGGNMLHTIRQVINNDSTWRTVLRGLNTEFRHRVVTGDQVRSYMSAHAGIDLRKIFEQYLTTTKIPCSNTGSTAPRCPTAGPTSYRGSPCRYASPPPPTARSDSSRPRRGRPRRFRSPTPMNFEWTKTSSSTHTGWIGGMRRPEHRTARRHADHGLMR